MKRLREVQKHKNEILEYIFQTLDKLHESSESEFIVILRHQLSAWFR